MAKGRHDYVVVGAGSEANDRAVIFGLPIANIRHIACANHYEFGLPGETEENKAKKEGFDPARSVGAKLAHFAQERGMVLRPLRDSIAFFPPLVITEDEITTVLERFGGVLDNTQAWLS